MTHAERFEEHLFTELQFESRHLSPLRRLYRQMRGGCLGVDYSFRESPGLHANMTWHYASSPQSLEAFRRCLTDSHLVESLSIVHGGAQLLAACFVVVKGDTPVMGFHVDYGEREIPAGVTGTMLTPLIDFSDQFGHLDCKEGLKEFEYRYRLGEAILFDGKFEHRSQASGLSSPAGPPAGTPSGTPPASGSGGTRILVSWSIATKDARYRFAIDRIIDSQTK